MTPTMTRLRVQGGTRSETQREMDVTPPPHLLSGELVAFPGCVSVPVPPFGTA